MDTLAKDVTKKLYSIPCQPKSMLKGKNLLPRSKSFLFRVDPFSKGVLYTKGLTGSQSCLTLKNW